MINDPVATARGSDTSIVNRVLRERIAKEIGAISFYSLLVLIAGGRTLRRFRAVVESFLSMHSIRCRWVICDRATTLDHARRSPLQPVVTRHCLNRLRLPPNRTLVSPQHGRN